MSLSVRERCNAIEECYEFMLAYAAQGVAGEAGSPNADQLRTLLARAEEALVGLADTFAAAVAEADLDLPPRIGRSSRFSIATRSTAWPPSNSCSPSPRSARSSSTT